MPDAPTLPRRDVLAALAAGAAAPFLSAARPPDALSPTPEQTEGPFYPGPSPRGVGSAPIANDLTRVGWPAW